MADVPMQEPNGAGGGFGGFRGDFGDDGDGEFHVSLEIEVRLDLETSELGSTERLVSARGRSGGQFPANA